MNKSKTGGDLKDLVIIFNLDSNIDQPSGITTFDKVINRLSNNQQTPVYTLLKGFDLIAMEIDPDLTPNKIISKIEDESNSKVYLANNSSLINYKSVIFYFRTIMLESNYSSFISKVLLPFILIRTRYSKEDSSPIKDKLRFLLCIDNQAGSRSYHKLSHDMLIETMIEQKHWKKK